MSQQVEQILDRVYQSALNPERWPDALASINEATGYASSCLIVDSMDDSGPSFHATRRTERALADFIGHGFFASCAARLAHIGRGRFAHESEFPASSAKRPAVETLRRLRLWDQTATQHCEVDGRHFVFTFEREADEPGFSRAAVDLLDQLRPHMVRSVMLSLPRDARPGSLLSSLSVPVLIVGSCNKVFEANVPALLHRPTLVAPNGTTLCLKGFRDDEAVRLQLADAATRRRPIAVRVQPRDPSLPALSLQAVPTRWCGAPAQLMTVAPQAENIERKTIATRFQLTPREGELAALLCAGYSLSAAADRMGMSRETARHHLKQIFQKTDTHRQGQLVALIAADGWTKADDPPPNG